MKKKDKLTPQQKIARGFAEYVKDLEKKAKDQNMSFKEYLEKRFLNKPLGDLGKMMLHGRFFSLNVLKVKAKRDKDKKD